MLSCNQVYTGLNLHVLIAPNVWMKPMTSGDEDLFDKNNKATGAC